MTSKIVVNNIEADAGVSTVFFNSDIGATDGTLNVDGNLTVDGVITYEDVTSVDSVGIVTAQAGIHVTGGNVGIGTDNPAQKLDVIGGNVRVGKTSNGKYIAEDSLGQSKVIIDSSGTSYLNGGNIGIGTDNPTYKLHVNDTAGVGAGLLVQGGGSGGTIAKFERTVGSTGNININVSGSDPQISFGSANNTFSLGTKVTGNFEICDASVIGTNQRLVINTSGNIGIGTDNPVGSLEVRDSKANLIVAKDGLTVKSNSNLHTTYDTLQIGAGGALLSYSTATATADTQFVHNAYRSSGGTFKYRYADTAARLRVNSPGRTWIFESAGSGNADSDISFSEQLRIDSDGFITQGGKIASNHGSPNLLLWGADPTMMIASTGSTANTSYTGIKFAVAGGSTGDYSKAGIFVQRQDSYNDLDMIFAFRSTNDAAGVAISDEKLRIDSDGRLSINHNSPNTRLYVRESGVTISSGNAILNSTQKGIRLVNSNNDDTSLGLWFTTGDSHHAGISGQRNDYANTWGTDLRFYTHEDATNALTYARERHRINPHGLLVNRKGQNAANTGGTILGRYKYTQKNQGSGYAHLILGPDGRKLQDYITTNCYAIITVCVTGTGTTNMYCQYYYMANSTPNSSSLTHMYGNSGSSSNRPYMNLQNTHDPAWLMSHNGQYRLDIEVAVCGGADGFTYTSEYGDFTTNP